MNVLVISHTYISPVNRTKWKVLAERSPSINLTVAVPHQWPTHFFMLQAQFSAEEQRANCRFVSLKARLCGNEKLYFYAVLPLIRLLRQTRPDIIHVEQGLGALSYLQVMLIARLLGLKSKFSFFTWINWQPPTRSLTSKFLWPALERLAVRLSGGALAGNQDARTILEGKGVKYVKVLPQLGVDTTLFRPARLAATSEGRFYIGYIGRIVEEKGIMMLIQAFAHLAPQFPNWNLLIVGAGEEEKALIDFALHKKLLDRIEFKTPVSHEKIATIMQGLHILALPSYDTPLWREQFGHVLIEAMACKIPVVGSTGGEIPQVIAGAGLIFEQRNEESLRSALRKLMSSTSLRAEIGQKGYQKVIHEYTHEAIASKTVGFWHSLP